MAQSGGAQVVGNIGIYYAAYRLSQQGWNVMPTARTARGVDLLVYDNNAEWTLLASRDDEIPF
jgi:hypothetical protein